jgi:hypothetical protein
VSSPVARFVSSGRFLVMALAALGGGAISGFAAYRWQAIGPEMWIPLTLGGAVLVLAGSCLLLLALRPAIEIHESHLVIGRRAIEWCDVRRLDQSRWSSPLLVSLTMADDSRVLLVYAGDPDSSASLLRHLRRYSREALLDGIPYPQFWGETSAAHQLPPPRYPLLRPEDEEEIERMFQRLKSVGRLDHRADSSDPE